jgi:fructosamine-3-kinase
MYPLLNHVRLFGAKYIQPLEAAAQRVATVTAKRKAS